MIGGTRAAIETLLSETPEQWWYGLTICRVVRIKGGTLYAILDRLMDEGRVEACWGEDGRRRYRWAER